MSEISKSREIEAKESGLSKETVEANIGRVNWIRDFLKRGEIEIPEELKDALDNMAENIFGYNEAMMKNGLEKYAEASSGIDKTQYAAATLESMAETIQGEKHDFSSQEKEKLKKLFEEAAMALRKDGFAPDATNLEVIAKNIDVMVTIFKLEKVR